MTDNPKNPADEENALPGGDAARSQGSVNRSAPDARPVRKSEKDQSEKARPEKTQPEKAQPRTADAEGASPKRQEPQNIDLELMQRIAANQEAAVAELYDRFGSLVYRMALQSMPTRGEAEDAVQEVFVRLWRTADRYDPRKAALVTWVMLLTRRHLVDKLRRKRARIKPTALDEAQLANAGGRHPKYISDRLERDEHFAVLIAKIDTLPDLQRTVVMRAYLSGQTLRQISEEMDIPLGTIKSALSRALVRLRERTGEEASL
jgi:RNA polymerase sigma-70 factor (ECF subfamily)